MKSLESVRVIRRNPLLLFHQERLESKRGDPVKTGSSLFDGMNTGIAHRHQEANLLEMLPSPHPTPQPLGPRALDSEPRTWAPGVGPRARSPGSGPRSRSVTSPIFFSFACSDSSERRRQRLMDIETPRLTLDANDKLHNAGFKSQSHRIFASTRSDIISVYMSKETSGASSKHRRHRFWRGKSGPPTHHGRDMLNTRGMYDEWNWSIKLDPVWSLISDIVEKALLRLASTLFCASESR